MSTVLTPKDMEEQGMVIGTCEWCHDENVPVYIDSKRCEDCDYRFTFCSICKEEQFEDDHCRHIFLSDNGWAGSGGDQEETKRCVKVSFLVFLSGMPRGFAEELKGAIQSGQFSTFTYGSLLGTDEVQLNGFPYEGLLPNSFKYSSDILKLGDSDIAEQSADGWYWLVSLFENETPEANALTIQWIDEFISKGEIKQ